MTYHEAVEFAQTWGLLYLVVLAIGAWVYALWPSNAKKFEDAANLPLRED